MECNLANLFEAAVDAYPEREYVIANGKRRTYAEMEARANRLAHHLAAQGIGPGDHVGIYAYNSVEWVETAWAVFKLRAVWINVNYRYVKDELRYLLTNADLKALVHQREFAPLVAALVPDLPDLRHVIVIEDDTDHPDPRMHWPPSRPIVTSVRARRTTSTSSTPVGRRACPRAWCGVTKTSSTPSGAGPIR
jgi:acyl-CoA synthetase (AMP-forming)/AMP-acid ligase II